MHIIDYISGFAHREKRSARLDMNIVKKFLQFCHENGFVQDEFSQLFPCKALPTVTEIPSVYSPNEIAVLLDYLKNRETSNQKRDYAIVRNHRKHAYSLNVTESHFIYVG